MKKVDKEATLKEVLAEVSLVDIGTMLKTGLTGLGCFAVFLVPIILLTELARSSSADGNFMGLPDWLIYLVAAWFLIGFYTSDKSFHEHRFEIYLPKAGFVWSLPIAAYLVVGFAALPEWDRDLPIWDRMLQPVLFLAWWLPVAFALATLELGHRKLVAKREMAIAEEKRLDQIAKEQSP